MKIKFNELLDFEKHPSQGMSYYNSSKVIDLEFVKDEITYIIKCHLILEYSRWFFAETCWCPKEDDCEIKHFIAEPIKGFKYIKEEEVVLTDKDLRRLLPYIEKEITFE
jgi:hypothetical protein